MKLNSARPLLFLLCLLSSLGVGVSSSLAQPASSEAPPAEAAPPMDPAERLEAARVAFSDSFDHRPERVSVLLSDGEGEGARDSTGRDALSARLGMIEAQILSSREWQAWWAKQAEDARALSEAMIAGRPKYAKPQPWAERAAGLAEWSAWAEEQAAAQEEIFQAIQRGKDAAEEALEGVFEGTVEPLTPPEQIREPNAYERRSMRLGELEYLIEQQQRRRDAAETRARLLTRRQEAQTALALAVGKAERLSERGVEIATQQARLGLPFLGSLWQQIRGDVSADARYLAGESTALRRQLRQGEVEAELNQSEVAFRTKRIDQLRAELEAAGSNDTLVQATQETVLDWLTGKAPWIFANLLLIWIGVRLALRALQRGSTAVLNRFGADAANPSAAQRRGTLVGVFSGVVKLVVYTVGLLMALEQVGVNTGPLLGSVAVLGLAISFGSQNLIRDMVNGFFILLEDQYSVGDFVEVCGKSGTVERITIRTTWVYNGLTGETYAIPNGRIGDVNNMSRGNGGTFVDIGVSYAADVDQARDALKKISEDFYADPEWSDKLLKVPAVLGIQKLDDSAVVFRVKADTKPGLHWGAGRELRRRIKIGLDAAGIEIPFPQRVIHQAD